MVLAKSKAHKVSLWLTSRAGVCPCVCPCVSVNTLKLEYLRSQWADRNQILTEALLGWGKGYIRIWARSDWNPGFHGNRYHT